MLALLAFITAEIAFIVFVPSLQVAVSILPWGVVTWLIVFCVLVIIAIRFFKSKSID